MNHVDLYRWEPTHPTQPLQLVRRIPTGKTPSHQWIDSTSRTVYATMQESNEVIAIDLEAQAVKWRVGTGPLPADVYLTADDKTLFVALTGGRHVEVFDVSAGPARLVQRIETGTSAHAFRALGDRRHVFVGNRSADTISLIDTHTRTVVAELPGPGGPDCMELLADGKTLLISSRWARKVTVVDVPSRKVLQQVRVGKSPHGIFSLHHAPRQ
jgi:YVTN family beta-propeller protein